MLTLNRPELDRELDDIIEAFEQVVLRDGTADPRDFFPANPMGEWNRIAVELLCVDLQHRWRRSRPKSLREYRAEFSDVLQEETALRELAFEEFRLRRLAGEEVSAESYHHDLSIDTSTWSGVSFQLANSVVTAGTNGKLEAYPTNGKLEAYPTNDKLEAYPTNDKLEAYPTNDKLEAYPTTIAAELATLVESIQSFPTVGEHICGFELLEELGRGSFSIVYLAKQADLENRQVVVKLTSRFSLEPKHLARLQHTHIVPVYSVHKCGDLVAICMPYYGRITLADALRVAVANRIDEPAVLRIGLQVSHGLRHAHERGIVHRDIKPANILHAGNGSAMLLDFNLSDDIVSGGKSTLMVGGTLPYLSPEHLQAVLTGHSVGPASDIFSLGVVLFQMLTGQLPFPVRRGPFDESVRQMINDRRMPAPRVRSLNANVSHGLAAIVERMIAPAAASRYADAAKVIEDLERHATHRPLKYAPERSLAERSRKWCRRHPRLSSVASVSTIASLIVAALIMAFVLRGRHLEIAHAVAMLQGVRQQMPGIRAQTSIPDADDATLVQGIKAARTIAESYGLFDNDDWRDLPNYASLSDVDRRELERLLVQDLYLLASAELRHTRSMDETHRASFQQEAFRAINLAQDLCDRQSSSFLALGELRGAIDRESSRMERLSTEDAALRNHSGINTEDPFIIAIHHLRDRRYDEAATLLESIRDADPYDGSVWLLLGNAYAGAGRLTEADGCYTVCISMWPRSYLGYFFRGLCRMDLEQFHKAEADFTRVLNFDMNFSAALIDRALARREQHNLRDAERDLTQAIDVGSPSARAYFLRSGLRERLNDSEGARRDRELGMKLTPTDERSWIERGLARLKSDPAGALADFEQATRVNPRSHSAWRNIAHIYAEKVNQPEKAVAVLDRLIGWQPDSASDVVSRGVLYARLGRRAEAIADAERVLGSNPSPKQWFQLSCLYALTSRDHPNDSTMAIAFVEKSIILDPAWLKFALTDPDLNSIRALPEFQDILNTARDRQQRSADPAGPKEATRP